MLLWTLFHEDNLPLLVFLAVLLLFLLATLTHEKSHKT